MDMPAGTTTMAVKGGPQGAMAARTFDVATADGAQLYTGASDDRPGEQKEVPHGDWAFADCSPTPFPGKPDLTKLCVKGGFNPALAYTLAFTAKNPKSSASALPPPAIWSPSCATTQCAANPLAGKVRWAIGRGVSQSGNYLRSHIQLGFNTAEDGRIVFDGLMPVVGPRMLSINYRFATPGGLVGALRTWQ